ncbi:hypothetical protein [Idiomarina piscisalsi]|nr:hypothetical protein [Idiomarina piscisalsi]
MIDNKTRCKARYWLQKHYKSATIHDLIIRFGMTRELANKMMRTAQIRNPGRRQLPPLMERY